MRFIAKTAAPVPSHHAARRMCALLLALSGAFVPLSSCAVCRLQDASTGAFDWEKVSEVYPGIRLARACAEEPRRMRIRCLRIDAGHPDIQFHATPRSGNWAGGASEVTRKTTRNFLKECRREGMNMVAATNAAAWSPWPAPCDEESDADVLGLLVSGGVLVSPAETVPSFVVRRDGGVTVCGSPLSLHPEDVWVAVSGFGVVLADGVVLSGGPDIHPRTGIGVCPAGRYVYWLAIDGRQVASKGATTEDVGQWLRHFGAWNGLNMDGGGSTTLVLWDEGLFCGKARVVNRPVGCGEAGTERAIGGNLGVYYVSGPK